MDVNATYWQNRQVAVTGATGFLGYHLVSSLRNRGALVRALVRPQSITDRIRELGCQCVVAPLDQPVAMSEAMRGCEFLFHLAGAVDFGTDETHCREVNVQGTANALRAATQAQVRRMVHTSSIAAVGVNRKPIPLDETATWNLGDYRIPYSTTKREAEELVLGSASSLEVVVVNPSCIIGPDDFTSSEFGTLCKRFWRGKVPFYFGGGNNFVDVRDVAEGMLLAAEKGRPRERYLFGGENLTYGEFFRGLAHTADRRYFRMRMPNLFGRVVAYLAEQFTSKKKRPVLSRTQARMLGLYFYATSAKAMRELGYAPRSITETLKDTYAFWMPKQN